MSDKFIYRMFDARIKHPEHILVYANIINHNIIDHIHQHSGYYNFTDTVHHHCNGTGWQSVQTVKDIHY